MIKEKELQLLIGLINLNLSLPYTGGELAYWIEKNGIIVLDRSCKIIVGVRV